jgi:hypothetical protein
LTEWSWRMAQHVPVPQCITATKKRQFGYLIVTLHIQYNISSRFKYHAYEWWEDTERKGIKNDCWNKGIKPSSLIYSIQVPYQWHDIFRNIKNNIIQLRIIVFLQRFMYGRWEIYTKLWLGTLKGKDYSEDPKHQWWMLQSGCCCVTKTGEI